MQPPVPNSQILLSGLGTISLGQLRRHEEVGGHSAVTCFNSPVVELMREMTAPLAVGHAMSGSPLASRPKIGGKQDPDL